MSIGAPGIASATRLVIGSTNKTETSQNNAQFSMNLAPNIEIASNYCYLRSFSLSKPFDVLYSVEQNDRITLKSTNGNAAIAWLPIIITVHEKNWPPNNFQVVYFILYAKYDLRNEKIPVKYFYHSYATDGGAVVNGSATTIEVTRSIFGNPLGQNGLINTLTAFGTPQLPAGYFQLAAGTNCFFRSGGIGIHDFAVRNVTHFGFYCKLNCPVIFTNAVGNIVPAIVGIDARFNDLTPPYISGNSLMIPSFPFINSTTCEYVQKCCGFRQDIEPIQLGRFNGTTYTAIYRYPARAPFSIDAFAIVSNEFYLYKFARPNFLNTLHAMSLQLSNMEEVIYASQKVKAAARIPWPTGQSTEQVIINATANRVTTALQASGQLLIYNNPFEGYPSDFIRTRTMNMGVTLDVSLRDHKGNKLYIQDDNNLIASFAVFRINRA